MERAVLMCEGEVIYAHHLPPTLQTAESSKTKTDLSLDELVGNYEKDIIIDALKLTKGNMSKAAISLKTTKRILGYKISSHRIDFKTFR